MNIKDILKQCKEQIKSFTEEDIKNLKKNYDSMPDNKYYEPPREIELVYSYEKCGKCTCKETEVRRFEIVDDDFRVFPLEEIVMPQRSDDGSAGYDLRIPCDVIIKPHSHSDLIFTDVRVKMHKDEYLQLHVRSSIGCKKGLVLANATGIIDYSYYYSDNQGNIGVKFYNTTNETVILEKGERVCQGIFQKYFVTDNDQPLKECRTGSGFGSSGEK